MLGLLTIGGCRFDATGLPVDGSPRLDLAADAATDLTAADASADGKQSDGSNVSPECANEPAGKPLCRFVDAADTRGQSGTCQDGRFVVRRNCYASAPCAREGLAAGYCTKAVSTCTTCDDNRQCATTSGVCTLLFTTDDNGVELKRCCVEAGANGSGKAATTCADGRACQSGLCKISGHCVETCQPATAACSSGQCGLGFVDLRPQQAQLMCASPGGDGGIADGAADLALPPDASVQD